MKRHSNFALGLALFAIGALLAAARLHANPPDGGAPTPAERAHALELNGQMAELRAAAAEALQTGPQDAASLLDAARLLDLAASRDRIRAYRKVIETGAATPSAQLARRRLVLLYLLQGDTQEARKMLDEYRAAGGSDLQWPAPPAGGCPAPGGQSSSAGQQPAGNTNCPAIEIPGPLLAFERMAAIRPETALQDVLPAVARNAVMLGYRFSPAGQGLPTEYLKLIKAWLRQARELQALGGTEKTIRVSNCDQAHRVLKVIGYRTRGSCSISPTSSLEVDDPERAFLANNSGFPVIALETALRGGSPFEYSVASTWLPVPFEPGAWAKPGPEWIDSFLGDPRTARLYAAMAAVDTRTAELLKQSIGLGKLKSQAPTLDFFGRMIQISDGRVVLPGGPASAAAWKEIVGVEPDRPSEFIRALLTRDEGWAAAWFDSLWYADAAQLRYLTEPGRMVRFYRAVAGKKASPSPARSVFRGNTQLLLLVTSLRIGVDGQALLPGGAAFWNSFPGVHPSSKAQPKNEDVFSIDAPKQETGPIQADDVVEALFAQTRNVLDESQLSLFFVLNNIDRPRSTPLQPATVARLASDFTRVGAHYTLFATWPQLSDATILKALEAFDSLAKIDDRQARGDALGSFQALIAAWAIGARHGQIPVADIDSGFSRLCETFIKVSSADALVDASAQSLEILLAYAPQAADSGDRLLLFMAGSAGDPAALAARDQFASAIRAGLDSQKLTPLNTLLALYTQLKAGKQGPDFKQLAAAIQENLPAIPDNADRVAAGEPGASAVLRHLEAERDTDLASAAQSCAGKAGEDPKEGCLSALRGRLAPFLRDSLVGYIYAYYAPLDSLLLVSNPLFVRSHDFVSSPGNAGGDRVWGPKQTEGLGWPWAGSVRFVGTLDGIGYALADAEKDFLVPSHVQALIWSEIAPQVLLSGNARRWTQVSPRTQHWTALHLRLARDLLAEASVNPGARRVVLAALTSVEPQRREMIENALLAAQPGQAALLLPPSELYYLSRAVLAGGGAAAGGTTAADHDQAVAIARGAGPAAGSIEQIAAQFPQDASIEAASIAFGVPHPRLRGSYRPELLNMRTLPSMMQYSSRLLAESWESDNLYWAELADELAMQPAELSNVVPEATRQTVETIYANDLDDWPALLEALRATGAGLRVKATSTQAPAAAPNADLPSEVHR